MKDTASPTSASGTSDRTYSRVADEFGAALERLAYAYELNPDKRRDLLQEIHLQLWRSLENYHSRCSLRTWVYRVAHHVAISHVVKERRRPAHTFLTLEEAGSQTQSESLEISVDRQKALARLLKLIQQLDPLDRQLILFYLEGMDAASISEITGLSLPNISTKIHRVKNFLARQFHSGVIDGRR